METYKRLEYETENELLDSMREEDSYMLREILPEENHPMLALYLFVKHIDYDIEGGMVHFRGSIIPADEVYGCIMLYLQYHIEQPWISGVYDFYEYANLVGFSHDNADQWESYIPYRSHRANNNVENGQGKLLLAQLESFPEMYTDDHSVLVFGSHSGILDSGLSYPAIARLVSPNVHKGVMNLYDVSETTHTEVQGSYIINHHAQSITTPVAIDLIQHHDPDDIIYDMYDNEANYTIIQDACVRHYPYKRHLLKIPSKEVGASVQKRYKRIGIRCRMIDQVYYNGREIRMLVSNTIESTTLQTYCMITSIYPSQHSCYVCKRIHLICYRHNIDVNDMYRELMQMGIKPCMKYQGQRMVRKIHMMKRYLGTSRKYDKSSLIRYLTQHDLFATPEEMDMVYDFLRPQLRKRRKVQGDIYRKDMPEDYMDIFCSFPMGRVCVRMIGDFKDHWSFNTIYYNKESKLKMLQLVDDKVDVVYIGKEVMDNVRCISFPEGIHKYTQESLNQLIDSYRVRGMYMIRYVVIRSTYVPDVENFRSLFTVNGRGYFTTVYKRMNDYTDDKGHVYSSYRSKVYMDHKLIDTGKLRYNIKVGDYIVKAHYMQDRIRLDIPYNQDKVIYLYNNGIWTNESGVRHTYNTPAKRLKYALRHTTKYIDDQGWGNINEIEAGEKIDIFMLHREDHFLDKYELKGDYIRAFMGHTVRVNIPRVKIKDIQDLPYGVIVHGTTYRAWQDIKKVGLLPGIRMEIHFAIASSSSLGASGIPKNTEVLIYLDVEKFVLAGKELYMTGTYCVVTTEGIVEPFYFSRAIDYNTKQLLD